MRFFKLPVCLIVFCAFVAFASQAQALTINPGLEVLTGNETGQSAINTIIAPIIAPSVELYKTDFDGLVESGLLSGSYNTTFFPSEEDPYDAQITYTGGDIVGPIAYLLVKDGNATPAWYLFNLTALGWNGTETLDIKNFWGPDYPEEVSGAISHVTLYGGKVAVPEPTTMLLLGFGLIGLAGFSRRKFKTN